MGTYNLENDQAKQKLDGYKQSHEEKMPNGGSCRQEQIVRQVACDKCDTFGGEKTYANQVCMPLNGKVVCIDWCIHQIVAALNAGGIETIACCCGHNKKQGRIDLADGRVLYISKPSA